MHCSLCVWPSGTLGILEKGVPAKVPSRLDLQGVGFTISDHIPESDYFPTYLGLFSRNLVSQISDYKDYEAHIVGGWCDEGVDGGQGGAKPIWTFPHYKVSRRCLSMRWRPLRAAFFKWALVGSNNWNCPTGGHSYEDGADGQFYEE